MLYPVCEVILRCAFGSRLHFPNGKPYMYPHPHHPSTNEQTKHRQLLPLLEKQFEECAPPVPSEAGPRGPGFGIVVAAHALAGIGLTVGERGAGGRRRAAATAAGNLALLTDVARRLPLVFLEQVW